MGGAWARASTGNDWPNPLQWSHGRILGHPKGKVCFGGIYRIFISIRDIYTI